MIDDIDRKILNKLQKNARISNAQIARELNLAPSGIHERIKRLERHGIIKDTTQSWMPTGLATVSRRF